MRELRNNVLQNGLIYHRSWSLLLIRYLFASHNTYTGL